MNWLPLSLGFLICLTGTVRCSHCRGAGHPSRQEAEVGGSL